jgi:hypothetical protein
MEGRLGNDPAMSEKDRFMMKRKAALPLLLGAIAAAGPVFAGDNYGGRPLRYGNTSSWHFDARNDDRDFQTNGFFPGNFAAYPPFASIGAAGFLESNPYRSALPYPSQVYFGPLPGRNDCVRHYRPYDPAARLRRPCPVLAR